MHVANKYARNVIRFMALFGTFADVSIPDVISLIGNNSGEFIVKQQTNGISEIYNMEMEHAYIVSMSYNGQIIHSSEQAQSFLTELIRQNTGEFEFHRKPIAAGNLRIHVTQALLASLSLLDEMVGLKDQLPDPHTVFLKNSTARVQLNEDMQHFWLSIEPHLREGICAAELSDKIGIFLDQVLLKIYKLLLAEAIVPRRAFYAKTEPIPELATLLVQKEVSPPTWEDLTERLQPIWPSEQETTIVTEQPNVEPSTKLNSVWIHQPEPKLVNKFMNSLRTLIGKAA